MEGVGVRAPADLRVEERRLGPGLLMGLARRPTEVLGELVSGRDAVILKVGRRPFVVLNHPELVEQVFVRDAERFRSATFDPGTAARVAGGTLPTLEGREHAERRRAVASVFDPARLVPYARVVVDEVEALTAAWPPGGEIDLVDELERLQVTVLGRLTFGRSYDPASAALHDYHRVSRQVVSRFLNPLAPVLWRLPVPLTRRFERTRRAFNGSVDGFALERRADGDDDDLLARLLSANGAGLTDGQARDEAWTYFSQGVIMYALAWTFWLLGRDGAAEAAVHQEADGAGALADVTSADELPQTRAAVLESLRLYPPGLLNVRETVDRYELAGRTLEPGTRVLVCPWVLQRDARFWTDAEEFRPERWLEGEPAHPHAFVAFSAGPRRCPARSLAELTCVLAVASIMRRWRLRTPPGEPRRGFIPFIRPKDGLPTRLEPRDGDGS